MLNNEVIDITKPFTMGDIEFSDLTNTNLRLSLGVVEMQDTLDSLRSSKLKEIAARRYIKETSGVPFGGVVIKTDRESQGTISGAVLAATLNPEIQIDWKTDLGWVQLNKAQIEAIAIAVSTHVQQCFSLERLKNDQLLTLNSIEAITNFDTSF
jgi:hypothetical protein